MKTEPDFELLVGCVDARRPIGDYKLTIKNTRILRSIGAYIPAGDPDIEAALEYAINHDKISRITVASHTDCGAACACMQQNEAVPEVLHYLKPLNDFRKKIQDRFPTQPETQLREMELAITRESLKNLRSYPCVAEAEALGKLSLRGWLVDISNSEQHDVTNPGVVPVTTTKFPPHEPKMLLFSHMDPHAPVASLGIEKGQSLIVRNFSAFVPPGKESIAATLEFALKAKGIKKIVVSIDENSAAVDASLQLEKQSPSIARYLEPLKTDIAAAQRMHTGDTEAKKREIAKRILATSMKNLRDYKAVRETPDVTIEAWLVDSEGKKTQFEEKMNPAVRPAKEGSRFV